MKHRTLKNMLSFVLVLALTVGAIAALSMVTQAKTEAGPAKYSQEVRQEKNAEVAELSASVPKEEGSPLVSAGAFLLILAIPVAGILLYLKARRKGRDYREQASRRYSPRADMSLQGFVSAKTRV